MQTTFGYGSPFYKGLNLTVGQGSPGGIYELHECPHPIGRINGGKLVPQELEAALQCKYVAVEASKALAQIFNDIIQKHPSELWASMQWASILQSQPLNRPLEACDVLEKAAISSKRHGELLIPVTSLN